MMFHKKGQLKENTLELIIAGLGLLIIFGGGYAAYNYFKLHGQQQETQAKGVLEIIDAKIKGLKELDKTNVLIKGPCGEADNKGNCIKDMWYLTGWSKDDVTRPERCFFKSCVCACKLEKKAEDIFSFGDKELKNSCQNSKTGFCKEVESDKLIIFSKQIKKVPNVESPTPGDPLVNFVAEDKQFIPFRSNLIRLEIQKNKNEIIIFEEN